MPQASQNAALRAARGAALGQTWLRPVISPAAQFDNITWRREIIQCQWNGSSYRAIGRDGLTPAAVRFMQE